MYAKMAGFFFKHQTVVVQHSYSLFGYQMKIKVLTEMLAGYFSKVIHVKTPFFVFLWSNRFWLKTFSCLLLKGKT